MVSITLLIPDYKSLLHDISTVKAAGCTQHPVGYELTPVSHWLDNEQMLHIS